MEGVRVKVRVKVFPDPNPESDLIVFRSSVPEFHIRLAPPR